LLAELEQTDQGIAPVAELEAVDRGAATVAERTP
jgi:hypothetical protein